MSYDYQEFLNQIHSEIMGCAALWEIRYADYAVKILQNTEKLNIHVNKPLFQYTTVSNETAKGLKSILRFCGQEVGSVEYKNDNYYLVVSDSNAKHSIKHFSAEGTPATAGVYDWSSQEAENFRKFFRDCAIKKSKSPEHTLESLVLTELEKTSSTNKSLLHITPVKISGRRFQMPTPLSASNHKNIHVAASGIGGGIDILARQKCGNRAYLNVVELKDEYSAHEPPEEVIKQAIAYAAFLRNLIRSEKANGENWCEIFGVKYPQNELVIRCTVAMPNIADITIFDEANKLTFDDDTGDCLELHLMNILWTYSTKLEFR